MNQLFLAVVAVEIILQTVAGAPIISCNKLEAVATNNRYLVLLKDTYSEEDAKQIIKIVDEYQSSLEENGSGNDVDNQSVISSQLTYHSQNYAQLSGTLSPEAVLLVCNEDKVKSIRPDIRLSEYGNCNLPEDTEEYSKIVFEYNVSHTGELYAITEKVQSIAGVIIRSAKISNTLNSVLFQMNRTAYYNACTYPEVVSVKYYKDSPMWIEDNLCRNLSRAITLFGLNETDFQRYSITFNNNNSTEDAKICRSIVHRLNRHTKQGVTANLDVNECSSDSKLIAGYLNVKALELVCNHHSADKVVVVKDTPIMIGRK